jgi:hypothetical protein
LIIVKVTIQQGCDPVFMNENRPGKIRWQKQEWTNLISSKSGETMATYVFDNLCMDSL